jgi:hypothetical protein
LACFDSGTGIFDSLTKNNVPTVIHLIIIIITTGVLNMNNFLFSQNFETSYELTGGDPTYATR